MPAGRWLALRIAIATGRPAPPVAVPPGAGHKRSSEPRVQGSNITGQCRRSLVTVELLRSHFKYFKSSTVYVHIKHNEKKIYLKKGVYCQEISHFNVMGPTGMSFNRVNIWHSNVVTTNWSNLWVKNVSSMCVGTL